VRYYEVVTVRKNEPEETVPTASVKESDSDTGLCSSRHCRANSDPSPVASIDKANGTNKAPDGTIETVQTEEREKS
jgi:hypothetical protein